MNGAAAYTVVSLPAQAVRARPDRADGCWCSEWLVIDPQRPFTEDYQWLVWPVRLDVTRRYNQLPAEAEPRMPLVTGGSVWTDAMGVLSCPTPHPPRQGGPCVQMTTGLTLAVNRTGPIQRELRPAPS